MPATDLDRIEESAIYTRGLSKRFGAFTAVDAIDISVRRGQVFGLLGANGAGKTTAIRMLCGTLPPSAGEIRVAGFDMIKHARSARARIGYVTQRFTLYDDLTFEENLRLQAGLYGLGGREKDQRIAQTLHQLDLTDRKRSLCSNSPLGHKRRLALGAALLHRPHVLFLDEPTSGVDPMVRQQFWELIYELAAQGIGILVTTHYMDEALFCDRLALMASGRVICEDTPDALMRRPLPNRILELSSPQASACAGLLGGWPQILEIIPHAGALRLRLQAGVDPEQLQQSIRQAIAHRQLPLSSLQPALPELEDVFVALLEQAQQNQDGA